MRAILVWTVVLVAIANGINGEPGSEGKKQICEPGSQSRVDCNTCRCSRDGSALACTRMECPRIPAGYLNPDGSIKRPDEINRNPLLRTKRGINGQPGSEGKKQICEPGTQSRVDCNTCTCSQDGTALGCTRMGCPKIPAEYLNPDGSIKRPDEINRNPLLRTKRDQVCEPGTTRKWKCNDCRCSPDGTAEFCTRQVCPDSQVGRRDARCTPNESFMDDCNHCMCGADGHPIACTAMACTSLLEGVIKNSPQNNPQQRTRRDQVCVPGTTRKWECNQCRCSPDGSAEYCTRKGCPETPRDKRDAPFSCKPKERFMQDCNTCVCSPDGRSAACTLMFCL